jgi:16S rRNA (cytosine967-C5)-methyltransferase
VRDIAFELLRRVEQDDSYANLLLPKLLAASNVDSRDAGFIQELSFGALRNKLFYESVIELASSRMKSTLDSAVLIVLVLGTHQLLGMRVPAHAAINESVNLAKAKCPKSAVGFVNAVLRRVSEASRQTWVERISSSIESEEERLSVVHSHPSWITKSLKAALASRGLGDTLEDLLLADNTPARVSAVALPGFCSIEDLAEFGELGDSSPLSVELNFAPTNVPLIQRGFARVQDQGSQLAVMALVNTELPTDDVAWLDICAGPGGKAALMAAIAAQRSVSFDANEISVHRAKLVANALAPISDTEVSVSDGRDLPGNGKRYSRILLDAPCTGLGALRRRPEARWRKSPSDIAGLSRLQRELFTASFEALLPGGVLAYVTCSPHLSETTALVSWAEAKFQAELELLSANSTLNRLNPKLRLDETFKTAQLWPHIHGTDAMFIALFRKKVNS